MYNYNYLYTVISHLSSTNTMFHNYVVYVFLYLPSKVEVKCDNMPHRAGTL